MLSYGRSVPLCPAPANLGIAVSGRAVLASHHAHLCMRFPRIYPWRSLLWCCGQFYSRAFVVPGQILIHKLRLWATNVGLRNVLIVLERFKNRPGLMCSLCLVFSLFRSNLLEPDNYSFSRHTALVLFMFSGPASPAGYLCGRIKQTNWPAPWTANLDQKRLRPIIRKEGAARNFTPDQVTQLY